MHRQGFLMATFVKHHSGGNAWKFSQYHSKLRASFQSTGNSTDPQVGKGDTWRKSKSRLGPSQSDQAWVLTSATGHSIQWREAKEWLWPSPRPGPLTPQRSREGSEKASGSPKATQLSGTGLLPKPHLIDQLPPSSNIGLSLQNKSSLQHPLWKQQIGYNTTDSPFPPRLYSCSLISK